MTALYSLPYHLVAFVAADPELETKVYSPAEVKDLELTLEANPFLPFEGYERVMAISGLVDYGWDEALRQFSKLHDEDLRLHLGVAESVSLFCFMSARWQSFSPPPFLCWPTPSRFSMYTASSHHQVSGRELTPALVPSSLDFHIVRDPSASHGEKASSFDAREWSCLSDRYPLP